MKKEVLRTYFMEHIQETNSRKEEIMARKIHGKINVENFKPPGTLLRVVAWDADIDADDHMGIAPVAEDGSYSIEYKDDKWDWSPVEAVSQWRPDIYVVIEYFDPLGAFWRPIAKSKVYSNQDVRLDREIDLTVSMPNTDARTVYGRLTDENGNPLKGFTVTAWDEDPTALRNPEPGREVPAVAGGVTGAEFMGSAVTDENGEYRIHYDKNWWDQVGHWSARAGAGAWWRPDVFIKVHNESGSGVMYRSPTHQNILQGTGVRIDAKIGP
jgi:hypothetical protein